MAGHTEILRDDGSLYEENANWISFVRLGPRSLKNIPTKLCLPQLLGQWTKWSTYRLSISTVNYL